MVKVVSTKDLDSSLYGVINQDIDITGEWYEESSNREREERLKEEPGWVAEKVDIGKETKEV